MIVCDFIRTQLTRRMTVICAMLLVVLAAAPASALDFDITYHSSVPFDSLFRTHMPLALEAWQRVFSDDVTIKINVRLENMPSGYTASCLPNCRNILYNTIRSDLIGDADGYEAALMGDLPDFTTFQANAHIPDGWSRSLISSSSRITQANALALGHTRSVGWSTYDMTIRFNNDIDFWDFDSSDGVTAGQVGFYSTAQHEAAHGLGFYSIVDSVDQYLHYGSTTTIRATPMDFFRTAAGEVDTVGFTDAARILLPGNAVAETGLTYSNQVTHTGQGEILMATGAYEGDGYQASHFKSQFASPTQYRGIMTPLAALGPLTYAYKQINANDLMTLGLMGWDVTDWSADASMTWGGVGAGGSGIRWEDHDNWNPYATPALDHDVIINQTGPGWVKIDYLYAYARDLTINSTASGSGGVRLTGMGKLLCRNLIIGDTDNGLFQQTSSRVTVNGNLYLGKQPGSTGTYKLYATTLNVVGSEYIGAAGTGLIDSRATHTVGGTIYVGRDGPGTLEIRGTTSSSKLTVGGLEVGAAPGAGTLAIYNTSAVITVNNYLKFGANGVLVATTGSKIHMAGAHFENESATPSNLSGLADLELIYDGGTGQTDHFELAGLDLGRSVDGFVENFTLGALTLCDNSVFQLVDVFDNGNRGGVGGIDEALYLENLTLDAGATLDLAGFHLYVRSLDYNGGDVIGGELISMIPGDADGNWKVDGADLAFWQTNYDPLGLNENAFDMGDWTGDGRIDGADLALWQQHYDPLGSGFDPNLAMAIPEPATLLFVGTGFLALIAVYQRRRMH